MLSLTVTILILILTLFFFFLTVVIPYSWRIKALLRGANDDFVSARGSQSWFTIGCSLYAGAVGTWCLTVPVETAADGGMWAVIGYAIACGFTWSVFLFCGPLLRSFMQYRGFTCVEFMKERYGIVMNYIYLIAALLYLFIILVSELIAIGSCVSSLSPYFPRIAATVAVASTTAIYSALGGFPATLVSDKIQAVLCFVLIIVCYGSVFVHAHGKIPTPIFQEAFQWPSRGLMTGACLIISCFTVEPMNQGTWQRVFAAKDKTNMIYGFIFGMCLMFPSMIVFGLTGIFATAARDAKLIIMGPEDSTQGLFLLISTLPNVYLGLVLILAVGLVTSTADYIQTSMVATIAGILPTTKTKSLNVARLIGLMLNVPAVIIASFNPPQILTLMMLGNVVTAAVVPVFFMGFLPNSTPLGAIGGVIGGLLMVFIVGWGRTNNFVDGLSWFMFPNGYNWECFLTFVCVLCGSGIICWIVSKIVMYLDTDCYTTQLSVLAEMKRKDAEAAHMLDVEKVAVEEVKVKELAIKQDSS